MRKNYGDAISLILYFFDEGYRLSHPNISPKISIQRSILLEALKIAEENGLLYYFSQKLLGNGFTLPNEFSGRIEREKRRLSRFKKTLEYLTSLFEHHGISFLFIKLYKGLPYVPRDIDVLVKNEQINNIQSILKKRGFFVKRFDGVETACEKKGLMKVDLYQSFYYLSLQFIDEEFLWRCPRTSNISGIECPIPSPDADLLILLIHALLGHRALSLLDFLYAESLLNDNHSFDNLLQQTEKHKWTYAFFTMLLTIQDIYNKSYLTHTPKCVNFPLAFSPKFILRAFQNFTDVSGSTSLSTPRKVAFIFSTLIDNAYLKYQMVQRSLSTEMPEGIKDFVMKHLHKVRSLSGDRKRAD